MTREKALQVADLEDKIAAADKVELHYKPPYKDKYAVVEYCCRQGKPLKLGRYYIYGEELKTGKPLICWYWMASCNFNVIEDGFDTYEEALTRLKELRRFRP